MTETDNNSIKYGMKTLRAKSENSGQDFDRYATQLFFDYKERNSSETKYAFAQRNNLEKAELESLLGYARRNYKLSSKKPSLRDGNTIEDYSAVDPNSSYSWNIIDTREYTSPAPEKEHVFLRQKQPFGKRVRSAIIGGLAGVMTLVATAGDFSKYSPNDPVPRGEVKEGKSLIEYFFGKKENKPEDKKFEYFEVQTPRGPVKMRRELASEDNSGKIKPSDPKKYKAEKGYPQTPIMPSVDFPVYNQTNTVAKEEISELYRDTIVLPVESVLPTNSPTYEISVAPTNHVKAQKKSSQVKVAPKNSIIGVDGKIITYDHETKSIQTGEPTKSVPLTLEEKLDSGEKRRLELRGSDLDMWRKREITGKNFSYEGSLYQDPTNTNSVMYLRQAIQTSKAHQNTYSSEIARSMPNLRRGLFVLTGQEISDSDVEKQIKFLDYASIYGLGEFASSVLKADARQKEELKHLEEDNYGFGESLDEIKKLMEEKKITFDEAARLFSLALKTGAISSQIYLTAEHSLAKAAGTKRKFIPVSKISDWSVKALMNR